MTEAAIIQQAKHYFGKNRTYKRDLVLAYEFKGKNHRQWKKDIQQITSNAADISFKLFDDIVLWIEDNKKEQIDWKWIGDLSWTIDIVLNPGVAKGYDWDKKLALRCNGTARILKVFISDVIPCYTYDIYYMTYSKEQNYYGFGPLLKLTKEERSIVNQVKKLMTLRGFQFVGKKFCEQKFKELYSDTNSDGNASLFDVLFSDVSFYTTETQRFSDKEIFEESGHTFRWTEWYNKNGTLKERMESRWTGAGDYLKVIFNGRGQIIKVAVTRKEIHGKKSRNFELDIEAAYQKQKTLSAGKKNHR